MPANFEPLKAEIAALTTARESAVTLINGFHDRLLAAITADNLADDSAVVAFAAQVHAETSALSDAVATGTEPPPA